MLEALFAPETAEATAQIVSGASDLGVTGMSAFVAYKIVRLCEAGRAFLEAQTKALQVTTEAVASGGRAVKRAAARAVTHAERTEAHQRRLEELLEAAA